MDMEILYPKIRLALLPTMFAYAGLGGILAGLYGIVHDQVTYTISTEYFTHLKFEQFQYADFGLPPRVLVAEIGFLASWWVGFLAAWFVARLTVPAFPKAFAFRYTLRGFIIIFGVTLSASSLGYLVGLCHSADYSAWQEYKSALRLADLPSFVRVAYIHNASYLGGLVGLIVAIFYVRRLRQTDAPQPPGRVFG